MKWPGVPTGYTDLYTETLDKGLTDLLKNPATSSRVKLN